MTVNGRHLNVLSDSWPLAAVAVASCPPCTCSLPVGLLTGCKRAVSILPGWARIRPLTDLCQTPVRRLPCCRLVATCVEHSAPVNPLLLQPSPALAANQLHKSLQRNSTALASRSRPRWRWEAHFLFPTAATAVKTSMERCASVDREPLPSGVAVADAWTSETAVAGSDVDTRRVAEAPPLLDGNPGATGGGASSAPVSFRELPAVRARPSPQTTFQNIGAAAASTVDTIGGRLLPTRYAANSSTKIFMGLPTGVSGGVFITDRLSMRPAPIRARPASDVGASLTWRPGELQQLPQSMPLHLRLQRRDLINAPPTSASSPPPPAVNQSLAANPGAARSLVNDNVSATQLAYTSPSPPPLAALPEPMRPSPVTPVCFAPPASPAAAATDAVLPPNCPAPSPHVADAPDGESPATTTLLRTCDICFHDLPPTMFGSVASCCI